MGYDHLAYQAAWREANRERMAAYREANRERKRAHDREYSATFGQLSGAAKRKLYGYAWQRPHYRKAWSV